MRVGTLLVTALQNLLDPACEPAAQASDLRCVLRCVRTVLTSFHAQLRSKCGVFVETLLAGGAGAGMLCDAQLSRMLIEGFVRAPSVPYLSIPVSPFVAGCHANPPDRLERVHAWLVCGMGVALGAGEYGPTPELVP